MLGKLKKFFNPYKKMDDDGFIDFVAKAINKNDINVLEKIISTDSRNRFGKTREIYLITLKTIFERVFKGFNFIITCDKYNYDNDVIATGLFWDLNKKGRYVLVKKDIGLFLFNGPKRELNIDGLVSQRTIRSEDIESGDCKIYISRVLNYYNQKIYQFRFENNTQSRFYFRKNVDDAKIRIYSANQYEECVLESKTMSGCIQLDNKAGNIFRTEEGIGSRFSVIELSNYCEEKDFGVYKTHSKVLYKQGPTTMLDKEKTDECIINIKNQIAKILEVKTIEDFYEITDRDMMENYYKRFVKSANIDYGILENKLLSEYMRILQEYKKLELGKVFFEDKYYKMRLYVDLGGQSGFVEINLNKKNNKFVFLAEYLTECLVQVSTSIEIKTNKILGDSLNVYFCEKTKKVYVRGKISDEYINQYNYFKLKVKTDNGKFIDYLEGGDKEKSFSIEKIKNEDDIKEWCEHLGYMITTFDAPGSKYIENIEIVDDTEFILESRKNAYKEKK